MKRKLGIAAMLLLCAYGRLQAQYDMQPLKPGDAVPDVALKLVNYVSPNAHLYNFTNKLLILEFWSPSCSYCARQVAVLDKLQQQFAGPLTILPVSTVSMGDNAATISHFIKGYKQRVKDGFMLPVAVEDTVLVKAFPVATVPDYVWIYMGRYIAHTLPETVTAENIAAVVNGKAIDLPQKPQLQFYDPGKSIAAYAGDSKASLAIQHLWKGEIEGLELLSGFVGDTASGVKVFAVNQNALSLYRLAYRVPVALDKNRIINLLKTDTVFNTINSDTDKVYSYEFTGQPGEGYNVLRSRMQADLCNYFKIKGSIEQREMPCYVLQVGNKNKLCNSGRLAGNSLYDDIESERVIYNQPVIVLTERLNQLFSIPVLDESGLKKPIDLTLPNDLTDTDAMQKALATQGILLRKTLRTISVFVLTPVNNNDCGNSLFTQ